MEGCIYKKTNKNEISWSRTHLLYKDEKKERLAVQGRTFQTSDHKKDWLYKKVLEGSYQERNQKDHRAWEGCSYRKITQKKFPFFTVRLWWDAVTGRKLKNSRKVTKKRKTPCAVVRC